MSNKYSSLRMKLTIMAMLVAMLMTLPLMSGSSGPPEQPILRINTEMHTAVIMRIGVDRSETTLITASNDKTVKVWDINTGRLKNTLRVPIDTGRDGKLYAAAISPDGSTVAAGGWTGFNWDGKHSIYLLDARTGRMRHRISGLPEVIFHLTFSPDGRYLAAVLGAGNGLRVYDTRNWSLAAQDTDYGGNSYWADFDHAYGRGRLVTVCCFDGYVRLYDKDFKLIAKRKAPGGNDPYSCAFSPDGVKVAVGFDDTTKVNVLSGKDLSFMYAPNTGDVDNGSLNSVAWSADGGYLYAGGRYSSSAVTFPILRWSDGGRGPARPGSRKSLPGALNAIIRILPLSDGRVAYGAGDPAWGVLSASGERRLFKQAEIADYRGVFQGGFLVSEDGAKVRFGYEYGGKSPAVFSVKNRRLEVGTTGKTTDRNVYRPKVASTSGTFKITGWENTTAPIIDGHYLFLKNYEASRSLAISPDENSFVLGASWTVYCFDKNGKQLWQTPAPGAAWGVNVSGDGRLAIAALADGTIRWYRMTDGVEILAFFPHNDKKRWVMWTPSGYYAASPGGDDLIGWHLNNGRDKAPDFYPASRFRDKYYRPEITAQILVTLDESRAIANAQQITGRKTVRTSIKKILPPQVYILSPRDGGTFSNSEVTINFQVTSPSGEPVTEIKFLINGRPVGKERGIGGVRPGDSRSVKLQLPESDCLVSVVASNQYSASVPSTVSLRYVRKAAVASNAFVIKPKLYVLAIGVGEYAKKELRLEYADKDALDFANVWKKQHGRIYREVVTKVLVNEKATKLGILEGLDWIERQTTAKDVAAIFLAGHGVNDHKGDYYFLPYDADPEKLRVYGVPYSTVKDVIQSLPGKVLFFVDTCHSGNVMGTRRGDPDIIRIVNDLSSAENGAIVFAASTGRQYSIEHSDWQNGAFTKAVIEGLSGKADFGNKGKITINMLDLYISERVKELTKGRQTPTTAKPNTIPDFPIAAAP